jgi:glycosyltransferase involved in cell wall biosynthesis
MAEAFETLRRIFDPAWYSKFRPEQTLAGANLLADYWLHGQELRLSPSPYFAPDWYLTEYPEIGAIPCDPFLHFVTIGWREGRNPCPMFDTTWYLESYHDVWASDLNPLEHYVTHGIREGRWPSPLFDPNYYLGRYNDVAQAGWQPLDHYMQLGAAEGRDPKPTTSFRDPVERTDILFVSGIPDGTSHLYRVAQHIELLRNLGYAVGWISEADIVAKASTIYESSVVVIFRHALNPSIRIVLEEAKRRGIRLLFDVDDYVFDPSLNFETHVDGIRFLTPEQKIEYHDGVRRYHEMAELCDGIIGPTRMLVSGAERIGRPGYLLQNGFSEKMLAASLVARARKDRERWIRGDAQVAIGYASGSLTHQKDFREASGGIARVLRSHPNVRLVVSGALLPQEYPEFSGLEGQIETRSRIFGASGHAMLPFELATYDINIAPLQVGNPFCEAKSNLKYYEAALVGIPTVASPTEPYRSAIKDGENGYLAANEESWIAALTTLVTSPELRVRMGRNAAREAVRLYGRDAKLAELRALFEPFRNTSPTMGS